MKINMRCRKCVFCGGDKYIKDIKGDNRFIPHCSYYRKDCDGLFLSFTRLYCPNFYSRKMHVDGSLKENVEIANVIMSAKNARVLTLATITLVIATILLALITFVK